VRVGLGIGTHALGTIASAERSYRGMMVLARSLENANLRSDGVRDQGFLVGITPRDGDRERHALLGVVEAQLNCNDWVRHEAGPGGNATSGDSLERMPANGTSAG
jgi:hypothetical protein